MNQSAENRPEQEWTCPNCLGAATKTGNEITCEKCDASFRITKQQNKLKDIRISRRLDLLEDKVFGSEEPAPEAPPETPPEPAPTEENEDEDEDNKPAEDEDD